MKLKLTDQAWEILKGIRYPGFQRDIVSFGIVRELAVDNGRARIEIVLGTPNPALADDLRRQIERALGSIEGIQDVQVRVAGAEPSSGADSLRVLGPKPTPSAAAAGSVSSDLIPQVRNTIAVASGKGGVGKSTVAVNLAVALAERGVSVGLLDADIYGPSIPLMMGLAREGARLDPATNMIVPFEKFGVRFMSLGFLVEPDSAVIWRGPMVMKAIQDLLSQVAWGELDLLVVDMPPGTGDAQLTLSQRVRLAGAVIVTTPQDVALADAIKGVAMFRRVQVPVLGIVENMSYFVCPHCNESSDVFGHGGGRREADRLGVPLLGEIPLDPGIRASGDSGVPVAVKPSAATTQPAQRQAFLELADRVLAEIAPPPDPPDAAGSGMFDRFRKVWKDPEQ